MGVSHMARFEIGCNVVTVHWLMCRSANFTSSGDTMMSSLLSWRVALAWRGLTWASSLSWASYMPSEPLKSVPCLYWHRCAQPILLTSVVVDQPICNASVHPYIMQLLHYYMNRGCSNQTCKGPGAVVVMNAAMQYSNQRLPCVLLLDLSHVQYWLMHVLLVAGTRWRG